MKFSVNWLREFVDLPAKIDEVADLLTHAGVEIESIEQSGTNIDSVIVAQITSSSAHPNADRLTVCEVDDGSGIKRQIVCGAKNYKVGDKVPLALPGSVLSGGLKIGASKLRGVESQGMLCSAKELGLGEDTAGLLILSPEAKVGASLSDSVPNDTILDVEITPNRGDLLSHFGLAREIAALVGKKSRGVAASVSEADLPLRTVAATKNGVQIAALLECPFYSARRIENVKVGPSPDWLRAKIEAIGVRSINNIVDISNFVMLELGQPTHAFDADKLTGGIHVRLAREGEKFLALDGKTYSLTPKNLVIADKERAVGIGGVMGGEETGVTASTRNVLLESAYFLPASIRRTARNLNLPSDASYRFERGVDPQMILPASNRAAELIREIAGGNPARKITADGNIPSDPPDVPLRYEKCDQVLGIAIQPKAIDQYLVRFGLSKTNARLRPAAARQGSKSKNGNKAIEGGATWQIPSHRRDLQRDIDLIEEIVRAHGVAQITGTDRSRFTASSKADKAHDLETELRLKLSARGLHEVRTSKLIPRSAAAFAENAIELRNPLSEDHVALRPSLIGGLLDVLARNVRGGAERVAIFELGRVFISAQATEERHLGVLLWGNSISEVHWRSNEKRALDFFEVKGVLESVISHELTFRRAQHPNLAFCAEIQSHDHKLGFAGQLVAALASKLDAPGGVLVAEINVDVPLGAHGSTRTFREIGRFPAITRDIAMIVPEKLGNSEIVDVIQSTNEPWLERVQLFDLFGGGETGSIGAGRKSLAYTLTYRDKDRTLTSEEVTAAHAKIRERLQSELGAELRE